MCQNKQKFKYWKTLSALYVSINCIAASKSKSKWSDRQKSDKDKENFKTKEEHTEQTSNAESSSGEITSQETGEVDSVAGTGPQVEFTSSGGNSPR